MEASVRLGLALRVAVVALLAEIILVTGITLETAQPGAPLYAGLIWALLKSLPLLLVLPGLLRGSHRAGAWYCFLLCAYFIGAVLTASTPGLLLPGLVEVAVVSTGFIAGMLGTRWTRGR